MEDFNGQCPTCRRIMPLKKPTYCEKMELIMTNDVCPDHIRVTIFPVILIFAFFISLSLIGWIVSGFVYAFWKRFFYLAIVGGITVIVFTAIVYTIDFCYKCMGFNNFCNPIRKIRNLYSDCLNRRRGQRLRRAEFERRRVSWLL
jgi:hypothetical protein